MEGLPKLHRSELVLVGVVGIVLAVGLVLWLALRTDPGKRVPLDRLVAEWTLEPRWKEPPIKPVGEPADEGKLAIYIDCSLPMGGYLPLEGRSSRSAIESILDLAPNRLASADVGPSSDLSWHSIGSEVQSLQERRGGKPEKCKNMDFNRQFFGSKTSRIDTAVDEILKSLESGEYEAAILVSDLIAMGNTEGVVGAQGLAPVLRERLQTASVLNGDVDFGLIGVKAPYWGVPGEKCKPRFQGRACRLSEQRQEWYALDADAKVPLYIIVFAHGREATVKRLNGLADDLRELDFEVETELLTQASAVAHPGPTECELSPVEKSRGPQYALFAEDGKLICRRSETIRITCLLPITVRKTEPGSGSELKAVSFLPEREKLVLELDCEQQRKMGGPFRLEFDLVGEPVPVEGGEWRKWSSKTDYREEDLGLTLGLEFLVDRIRLEPDSYQVKVRLLPEGVSDGK